MTWNNKYSTNNKIWGDKPSELALYAGNYLKQSSHFKDNPDIFILDLGCGYGRDAVFLAQNLPCHILGLDNSEKAVEMARSSITGETEKKIEFLCYEFSQVNDKYDVILASNLYPLLNPDERAKLRVTVKRCLKMDGVFFLSTFSVRDPQHFGKGTPVENEPNTFFDSHYIHLSDRAELEADFNFLNISALFEREFRERRSSEDHNHISWILMGSPK
jgi:cyclopropane fatty-acyl-phospholipid synthase-like methyltransferase